MKLLKVFNDNYLQIFRILSRSFCDINERKEDLKLLKEVQRIKSAIQKDPFTADIHAKFKDSIEGFVDAIFKKDDSLFAEDKLDFLKDIGFSKIWERMEDSEKALFWKNIISLSRYSSMMKACGSQLESMEDIALSFMQKKRKEGIKPENFNSSLFEEMLSGGEMSKKLLAAFKDKDCIGNVLSNVGDILRQPDDGKKGGGTTLSGANYLQDILSMTKSLSPDDIEKMQSEMIETIQEKVDENDE
jgi:hypothetical protein